MDADNRSGPPIPNDPALRLRDLRVGDWLRILRNVSRASGQHDQGTVAAAISFLAIFGVLSSLSAFVAFYGVFTDANSIASRFQTLAGFVPADTILAMIGQMNGVAQQGIASLVSTGFFSGILALWCAQQGMSTLMVALNDAYGLRTPRGPLGHLWKSTVITGEVVLGLIFTAIFAIGSPIYANTVSGRVPLLEFARDFGMLIGGVILFCGLISVYRWVPDRAESPAWRWAGVGAAVVIAFWAIASILFSLFLAKWDSYTAMYGSLSAVLILLTLTYVAVVTVLLGAELNAQLERYACGDAHIRPAQPKAKRKRKRGRL